MKDSSTEQTLFHIKLGANLQIKESKIEVFNIGQQPVKKVKSDSGSKANFAIDLSSSNSDYLFAIVEIQSYTYRGINYNSGERSLQLFAFFDSEATEVVLNEHSTIAGVFSLSQLVKIDELGKLNSSTTNQALKVAHGMKNNLFHTNGTISSVIKSSPNGLESNSYAIFNFLANLWYYCIVDPNVYASFLDLANSASRKANMLECLFNLVLNPFTNVEEIYQLVSHADQVFEPSIPSLKLPDNADPTPNSWNIAIKFNATGADNFLFGGAAFVVFDKDDKAWIANNVRQGTPNSGTFVVVLNSDGSPADFSPVFGGGVLGPGFGIAIDNKRENIYVGNYGWGPVQCNPQEGSISAFTSEGDILSPSQGFTNKLSRVQGMCFDDKGNLWMASWGNQAPLAPSDSNFYPYESENSSVVVYIGADPNNAVSYVFDSPFYNTFDVVIDHEGNAFVSNSGDKAGGVRSSVYKLKLEDGNLKELARWESPDLPENNDGFQAFRQVQVNSKNEVYVGAVLTNRILKFDNSLNLLEVFEDKLSAPWGVLIDANDIVYGGNFGKDYRIRKDMQDIDTIGTLGITVINEKAGTSNLIHLPTGGDEVTLPNGYPLYGFKEVGDHGEEASPPCYFPLMRITSCNIDRAGNLWAMNNWKPSAYIDIEANPGGDGVVVFLGAAAPIGF